MGLDRAPRENRLSRTAALRGDFQHPTPRQTRSRQRDPSVRKLAHQIAGQLAHPWDRAESFYRWAWSNVEPRIQGYTDVVTALRQRIGDCEERAAIFAAFCRAMEIPTRLVWIPNHNWAEFYLVDQAQQGHWIPAHTTADSWFGWTGAHELVVQKGDRILIPEKRRPKAAG